MQEAGKKEQRTFIVKPCGGAAERPIFLTKTFRDIRHSDLCVVQKYNVKSHLHDGFKYDFRVYAIITGVKPLRIYLYENGIVRYGAEHYDKPNEKNIKNMRMHTCSNEPAEDEVLAKLQMR